MFGRYVACGNNKKMLEVKKLVKPCLRLLLFVLRLCTMTFGGAHLIPPDTYRVKKTPLPPTPQNTITLKFDLIIPKCHYIRFYVAAFAIQRVSQLKCVARFVLWQLFLFIDAVGLCLTYGCWCHFSWWQHNRKFFWTHIKHRPSFCVVRCTV